MTMKLFYAPGACSFVPHAMLEIAGVNFEPAMVKLHKGEQRTADYLALKCVATVGGSWMLPADAVKSGNWEEVTRLSREAVELVKR